MWYQEKPWDPIGEIIRKSSIPSEISDQVAQNTHEQINSHREAGEKLQRTAHLIGVVERDFLHWIFNIPFDSLEAIESIKKIQSDYLGLHGDDVDGVIWPESLRLLYLRVYAHNREHLKPEQITRLQVYDDMQAYKENPRNVYNAQGEYLHTIDVAKIPDPFNDLKYWGGTSFNLDSRYPVQDFRARPGTMFAEWLLQTGFDVHSHRWANQIYIERHGSRHVLSLYDSNGKCIMACYTSPGEQSRGTNGVYNKRASKNTNKHYISNTYGNASMAYGINISDWSFLIHSWEGKVTWHDASKWCFRIPLAYAQKCFDYVRSIENFTLNVNI